MDLLSTEEDTARKTLGPKRRSLLKRLSSNLSLLSFRSDDEDASLVNGAQVNSARDRFPTPRRRHKDERGEVARCCRIACSCSKILNLTAALQLTAPNSQLGGKDLVRCSPCCPIQCDKKCCVRPSRWQLCVLCGNRPLLDGICVPCGNLVEMNHELAVEALSSGVNSLPNDSPPQPVYLECATTQSVCLRR